MRKATVSTPLAPVVRLVPPPTERRRPAVSRDTIERLEQLLEEAKSGKLQGMAFVAIYEHRNFKVKVCGEADRSPVFARGALASLDDELADRIRGV